MEPEKLIELLENKGLREFEFRKITGNQFLIDFDREELFDQCLNWEWVWLPEIFSDIIRWFKGYSPVNRVTWVAIYGVPMFAWNNYTFNNILNRWGVILFLEDEHLHGKDFSVKRAKILTNKLGLIKESCSLLCDGVSYLIELSELSFSSWANVAEASNLNKCVLGDEVDESSSSSFNSSCDVPRSVKTTPIQEKVFVSAKKMPAVEVDGSEDSGSWLPAVSFGHDCLKVSSVKDIPEAYLMSCGGYHKVEDVDRLAILNLVVNSTQLLAPCIAGPGCRFPMIDSCKLDQLENVAFAHGFGGCVSSEPLLGDVIYTSLNSVDVMEGCCTKPLSCLGVDADGKNDIVTNQALEDIRNMGLGSELNKELYEMILCSNVGISWAKRVDMANGNTEAYAIESEVEPEQENFFPELQDLHSRRKYGWSCVLGGVQCLFAVLEGVVMFVGRAAGCGGVLYTSESVICAIFSGPLPSLVADFADILVLRKAMQIILEIDKAVLGQLDISSLAKDGLRRSTISVVVNKLVAF
ncbi:hypothetical protein V6N13_134524 [Hibiscus sabdariffa]